VSAADHVQRARRATAKYARMTAEDSAELGAVFWQVARRQARDAATGAGGLLGRSLRRARGSPDERK
jgi:hypothetical protein